jgi:hypothetical protein
MRPEVYGFTEFTWIAREGNADLWKACIDNQIRFFVRVSNFGAPFSSWLCAFEVGQISLIKERSGRPILKLETSDEKTAVLGLKQAADEITRLKANLKFFTDIGWRN